jgi:phosphoribosylamine--glycine ligase
MCGTNVDIGSNDIAGLVDFAKTDNIGLAVIGPEDPLAAGIVDAFEEAGIKALDPAKGLLSSRPTKPLQSK